MVFFVFHTVEVHIQVTLVKKKMEGESVKKHTRMEFLSPYECERAGTLPLKLIRAVAWCVIPE